MASEWRILTLAEIYEFSSGLSKPSSEFGSGYPFLSFKDVFYNSAVPEQLTELVRSTEQERTRCSVMRGDVFLTRTSETTDELGMSSVALQDFPDATFNGFTKRLRPKSTFIVPEFARYFFRSPSFRAAVNSMSTMSTRASLNNEMLERLTIRFPESTEQKAIAHILGTLDAKIELNRKMIETLEKMARALFESWFVDFDPVRAKAEGRDPGLPAPIAAIFPNSFENSELGEIPKGWAVRSIEAVAAVASGKRPVERFSAPTEFASVPLWGGNGPMGFVSKPLFTAPIILTGRVGTLGSVFRINSPCWPSDNTLIISAKEPWCYEHLFFRLTHIDFQSLNRGSTQPLLTQTDIKAQKAVMPSEELLRTFHRICFDNFARVDVLKSESQLLTSLRDALIPKLITGEIRLASDAWEAK
jgi:type I restriction enzyme S subunit